MERHFTVIVPVYEQWHLVPALLACLERQTLPQDRFEVILADNDSPHYAPPLSTAGNVRIIRCLEPGSYAARNAAAAEASGAWYAFTDADCLPMPDWLEQLAATAEISGDRKILVGAVDMRAVSARPNAYEIYDMVRGIPQVRYARRGYGATANLSMSAALFHEAGGFDGARLSGGDAEFCRRATDGLAASVRFVAGAVVLHPARSSWVALATKARRVKGGQIGAGSPLRRLIWTSRSLAPPVIEWSRLLSAARFTWSERAIAVGIQGRLWLVEVKELFRLLFRGRPERS